MTSQHALHPGLTHLPGTLQKLKCLSRAEYSREGFFMEDTWVNGLNSLIWEFEDGGRWKLQLSCLHVQGDKSVSYAPQQRAGTLRPPTALPGLPQRWHAALSPGWAPPQRPLHPGALPNRLREETMIS